MVKIGLTGLIFILLTSFYFPSLIVPLPQVQASPTWFYPSSVDSSDKVTNPNNILVDDDVDALMYSTGWIIVDFGKTFNNVTAIKLDHYSAGSSEYAKLYISTDKSEWTQILWTRAYFGVDQIGKLDNATNTLRYIKIEHVAGANLIELDVTAIADDLRTYEDNTYHYANVVTSFTWICSLVSWGDMVAKNDAKFFPTTNVTLDFGTNYTTTSIAFRIDQAGSTDQSKYYVSLNGESWTYLGVLDGNHGHTWVNYTYTEPIRYARVVYTEGSNHIGVDTVRLPLEEPPPPPKPFVDRYTMVGIGLAGLILMAWCPTWVALKFRKKGFVVETIETIGYAMLLFFFGFGMFIIWIYS